MIGRGLAGVVNVTAHHYVDAYWDLIWVHGAVGDQHLLGTDLLSHLRQDFIHAAVDPR